MPYSTTLERRLQSTGVTAQTLAERNGTTMINGASRRRDRDRRLRASRSPAAQSDEPVASRWRTGQVRLPSGHVVGYDDYGPSDGWPTLYFHGHGTGSRDLQMFLTAEQVEHLGVRVIAADRPGYGSSDPVARYSPSSWADDMVALATQFRLADFAVLGWSAGATYALACAAVHSDRVRAAAVVSGLGPHDHPSPHDLMTRSMLSSGGRRPVGRARTWWTRPDPVRAPADWTGLLAEVDRRVLRRPLVALAYTEAVARNYRQGHAGAGTDADPVTRPWDFDPAAIEVPVGIWHGGLDRVSPVSTARWLAEVIPAAGLTINDDDGHLSLFADQATEVIGWLRP